MFRSSLLAIVAALVMLGAAPTSAQMVCGDRSKMVGYLDKDYKESRSGLGLASNGAVVELYTAESGTWTMLITKPGGQTCVIGSGESWETQLAPEKVAGEVS